jgi:hypothetical protein
MQRCPCSLTQYTAVCGQPQLCTAGVLQCTGSVQYQRSTRRPLHSAGTRDSAQGAPAVSRLQCTGRYPCSIRGTTAPEVHGLCVIRRRRPHAHHKDPLQRTRVPCSPLGVYAHPPPSPCSAQGPRPRCPTLQRMRTAHKPAAVQEVPLQSPCNARQVNQCPPAAHEDLSHKNPPQFPCSPRQPRLPMYLQYTPMHGIAHATARGT